MKIRALVHNTIRAGTSVTLQEWSAQADPLDPPV